MLSNLEMVKSTYEGDAKENGLKYQAYLAEHAEWTEAAGFPYAGLCWHICGLRRDLPQRFFAARQRMG